MPQLKASTAYDDNFAGFYASVGVADTGVDGDHDELSNVKSGYSWHGSQKGLSDPDGHGTHVTSLVAAKRDEVGLLVLTQVVRLCRHWLAMPKHAKLM